MKFFYFISDVFSDIYIKNCSNDFILVKFLSMARLFSIILFLGIIIFVFVGGDALWQIYLMGPNKTVKAEIFVANTGETAKQVADNLREKGFLKGTFLFETYVWWRGLEKKFRAGEFELKKGENISSLVKKLTTKPKQDEREITIPEGWNIKDIADYLLREGIIDDTKEFYAVTGSPAVDNRTSRKYYKPESFDPKGVNYEFLDGKPSYVSMEGYLFPDTYRIFGNATPKEIVEKMLNNFDAKLTDEMRSEIKKQGKSVFEIITMASVIQNEVRTEKDMKMVSDLFWRRLKIGMALQSDATVNYITGAGRAQPTYKDLEVLSPFNTYRQRGLPLGPICNPGVIAIKAAIWSTPNKNLYFLTTSDGTVIYSRTYEEHLANKAKYLK